MSSVERPSRALASKPNVWACSSRVVKGAIAIGVKLGVSGEGRVGLRMSSNNSRSISIVGKDPEQEV